jgi:hypothetical protein
VLACPLDEGIVGALLMWCVHGGELAGGLAIHQQTNDPPLSSVRFRIRSKRHHGRCKELQVQSAIEGHIKHGLEHVHVVGREWGIWNSRVSSRELECVCVCVCVYGRVRREHGKSVRVRVRMCL